jgi:cysteine desulfuration protein SufE
MTFGEKQKALENEMGRYKNPQDRLTHVIRLGREAASLPEELKRPELRLEGCLSNLWLRSEFRDGACYFSADSDSAIVKGLAVIICNLFSGAAPEEILKADLSALRTAGLWQQLTPNRRTGLARMVDRIHEFARAHLEK